MLSISGPQIIAVVCFGAAAALAIDARRPGQWVLAGGLVVIGVALWLLTARAAA